MPRRRHHSGPLPSHASAGEMVAGMLGSLDHLVANRPRPVAQIEEEHRESWASAEGMTVEGLDDRPDRREPRDRSGARL